ncbi:MAG: hypothetical protein LUD02_08340 [Tannerellaceae bacterium]|nr:hypothetical protein [Tannerellaceae bacterium]MCD8264155.1 hypothetical protein [Tannerellaceae bacterium]
MVEADLIRIVSRFDVSNVADGYELYSASIWNAYPVANIWDGNFVEFTEDRTERYYGVNANNNEIVGSLYAFENFVSNPSQKDKVTTCLIIGLTNKATGKIEYFRANINGAGDIGHQLNRNHAYRMVIKSVNSTGDENERGAYENGELLLDINFNDWILDEGGIIQIEGDNVLAIPTSEIKLFGQGDVREYYVYTIGQVNLLS